MSYRNGYAFVVNVVINKTKLYDLFIGIIDTNEFINNLLWSIFEKTLQYEIRRC